MNTQQFISYIERPELLGKNDIGVLKHIVADFPYFQAAQVLLTKALYNEKHYEFEKQLSRASLIVPDRAVLFQFVHQLPKVTEPAFEAEHASAHIAQENLEIVEEVRVNEEIQGDLSEVTQPTINAEKVEVTSSTPDIIEPIVETIAEPLAETGASLMETNVEQVIEIETASEHNENTQVAEGENDTHSFLEWLSLKTTEKDKTSKVEVLGSVAEEKNIAPKIDETAALKELIDRETEDIQAQLRSEIAQQVERSNVNEFESILDKFIRENPRITRAKAEFYNPVNMAKQSVEEDEELVTETLANVYYKQGNYKKAIRVYEKLCLLYPHKMPYFAGLIQKIKTENKD